MFDEVTVDGAMIQYFEMTTNKMVSDGIVIRFSQAEFYDFEFVFSEKTVLVRFKRKEVYREVLKPSRVSGYVIDCKKNSIVDTLIAQ